MRRVIALLLVALAALFTYAQVDGDPAQAALGRMRTAVRAITTYEVVIDSHQAKGSRTDDLTIRMAFKAPGWVRTEVLQGRNKGALAVFDPGSNRILARTGFLPAVGLSPDNGMALSLRGERIDEGTFPAMLRRADRYLAAGTVRSDGEQTVGTHRCHAITFLPTTPTAHAGVASERWCLDPKTHLPIEIEQRDEGGAVVARSRFRELDLHPDFPPGHFTPFSGSS